MKYENPMGKTRSIIKTEKPIDGGAELNPDGYANDRIIIRFEEGNREEQIADYEKVCNGKVQSDINTGNIYIFVFEPLSDKEMQKLLDLSDDLPYVKAASLDKISKPTDPARKDA